MTHEGWRDVHGLQQLIKTGQASAQKGLAYENSVIYSIYQLVSHDDWPAHKLEGALEWCRTSVLNPAIAT
jgi:hypothetical protein